MPRMALGMACALVLLVATAFSWVSWQREEADQLRFQQGVVEVGAQALDAYFLGLERDLDTLSHHLLASELPQAGAALAAFKRRNPELQIAVLLRPDGQVLATSEGAPKAALPSVGHEDSFIESRDRLLRGESMVVSRSFRGPVVGQWATPLRFGVRDGNGKLVYILAVGLPLSKTLSFWRDVPVPSKAMLALVRDDGYLVARHPLADGLDLEEVYAKPLVGTLQRYLAEHGYPRSGYVLGDGRFSGEHGGSNLVFRRLTHYPLTFYFRNPRSNLLTAWWQDVWFNYMLLGLLFAGGLGIYWWSARRQARWDQERLLRIEALEAANQELASFTYTISHDLRAPLRAVDGYAALQIEALAASYPQADVRLLDRVRENAGRMGKLIDGLLEFSRQSQVALTIRRVDMQALVQSVLRETLPGDSPVQVRLDELPIRLGDAAQLRKVWQSLIANAVKYSAQANGPRIDIGYENGEYFVRDNGTGFDMAHAPKLFGVFSRLHHATEFDGTGVSLAIARRIIERHGGRVWASAETGKGAEFRFTLVDQPLADGAA